MGAFAILTNYNPALHSVALVVPHLQADGSYLLEQHTCPLQTLYNACCVKDGYTHRTRGFVRVFRTDETTVPAGIKSKYPIALVDGRQSRGMLSIALDISIAPHILGLGLLHEVVRATALPEALIASNAAATGVELRGIPVTDICQRLGLPIGTIVSSTTRESLPLAAVWYRRYLHAAGFGGQLDVGCVQMLRRDNSDDGAVNIDEDDFFKFLAEAAANPKAAVLLSFDVNVAKNVRVAPDPSVHFALLMGFDRERGLVQLADVSVKKFRKVWHTTADLIYKSVIGHGFIVAAPTGDELASRFDGVDHLASLMTLARYGAGRFFSNSAVPRPFEHPSKNYSMTVLAKGLNVALGAPTVRVEDLIYQSGFHVSFMLSEHLPLLATQRASTYYCQHFLNDHVHSEAVIADGDQFDPAAFETLVKESTANPDSRTAVLVNFNGAALSRFSLVWNGSFGGNLALVIGYDASERLLLLEDSNPDPYYRRWECAIDTMTQCMTDIDPIADRARGTSSCAAARTRFSRIPAASTCVVRSPTIRSRTPSHPSPQPSPWRCRSCCPARPCRARTWCTPALSST
jgi:hypothetical protein